MSPRILPLRWGWSNHARDREIGRGQQELKQYASRVRDRGIHTPKGLSLLAALACWLFAWDAAAQPCRDGDESEPPAAKRSVAAAARAKVRSSTAEKPWRPALVTLYGHFAITGGPAGILGGSLEFTPDPHMSFELGAGFGSGGPQFAANGWWRPAPSPESALLFGGGVSGGPYAAPARSFGGDREGSSIQGEYKTALWVNPQIALEVLWSSGLRVRPYVGASFMLSSAPYACGSNSLACSSEKSRLATVLPILGLQIGGAFSD